MSLNGRWLAFNCNESGRHEIYVVSFPDGGARVRVSVDGGVQPSWKGDASELYFLGPDGAFMATEVATANGFEPAPPSRLFETGLVPSAQSEQYRVTADGQRFLLQVPAVGDSQRLHVIINWRERFKADQSASQ